MFNTLVGVRSTVFVNFYTLWCKKLTKTVLFTPTSVKIHTLGNKVKNCLQKKEGILSPPPSTLFHHVIIFHLLVNVIYEKPLNIILFFSNQIKRTRSFLIG